MASPNLPCSGSAMFMLDPIFGPHMNASNLKVMALMGWWTCYFLFVGSKIRFISIWIYTHLVRLSRPKIRPHPKLCFSKRNLLFQGTLGWWFFLVWPDTHTTSGFTTMDLLGYISKVPWAKRTFDKNRHLPKDGNVILTVTGRNPANQLRLVVYPIIYIHPRWCRISSINSR